MKILKTDGTLIFEDDSATIKQTLKNALQKQTNLAGANLAWADLAGADLAGADLAGVNLAGADLAGANLAGADLAGVNLAWADLAGADLAGADLAKIQITPSDGDFIAWKKCASDVLVKLLIPIEAKRSNSTGRKCRCEFAFVLEVSGSNHTAISMYPNEKKEYRAGEFVICNRWDERWWLECAGGIHFFITCTEAESYS